MRFRWWYWPLAIFTLPNLIATLVIGLIFYRPTKWRFKAGCLELIAGRTESGKTRIWGCPAAQSWGCNAIWYSDERYWDDASLRVHERIHTLHGIWLLGLPFAIAYGLHFLWEFARVGFKSEKWHQAYLAIWSERIAYRVQDEFEKGERDFAWGKE